MDPLDRTLEQLYEQFVAEGGLDQTERIVNEDFERIERQAAFCTHGLTRRACPTCRRPPVSQIGPA